MKEGFQLLCDAMLLKYEIVQVTQSFQHRNTFRLKGYRKPYMRICMEVDSVQTAPAQICNPESKTRDFQNNQDRERSKTEANSSGSNAVP